MRLSQLEIRQIEVPYGQDGYHPSWLPHVHQHLFPTTLVRVHDTEGNVGIGATNCFGREVVDFLRDHGERLRGRTLRTPEDIEAITDELIEEARGSGTPSMLGVAASGAASGGDDRTVDWGGVLREIVADPFGMRLMTQRNIPLENRPWCLDIALWDLLGKVRGEPVCDLLGRERDRVPVYASTGVRVNDRIEGFCGRLVDEGIPQVKLRVHASGEELDEELEAVERVIDAHGDRLEVGVDANQAWTPLPPFWDRGTAIEVGRRLDAIGGSWLEEPLGGRDLEGIQRVAEATDLPIVGGELESGEAHLVELMDVYDEINPDVAMATGFTLGRRVERAARERGIHWVPHTWDLGPGVAAGLQMACAMDECPRLEFPWDPWWTPEDRDSIMREPLRPVDGHLELPDRPGLGIRLNEDVLDESTLDGWTIDLETAGGEPVV